MSQNKGKATATPDQDSPVLPISSTPYRALPMGTTESLLAHVSRISVAGKYYVTSFASLVRHTSFWRIPLVFFRKPLVYEVRSGPEFYVSNLMDIWILKEIVLDRQYEFYDQPKKDWTVIDIGASIGDFSVLVAANAAKVYAFEADEERFSLAVKNISLNAHTNVEIVCEKVTNLDAVLQGRDISRCDLLKIDCEGCEYSIFEAASSEILVRIDRIVMEAHLFDAVMVGQYERLKSLLSLHGFALVEKANPVHRNLRFLYAHR